MKKYIIFLAILVLGIGYVSAAAPILKSVTLVGEDTENGVNYFDSDDTPSFTIVINATANYSAVCDSVNTFTAAAACNENVTTGCVAASTYSSGTTKTIAYTSATTNADYTIYCAACAKGAACDKTAISGGNNVTFHVRELDSKTTSIGTIIVLIAMGIGAFYILVKQGVGIPQIVSLLAALLIAAILVITIFNL